MANTTALLDASPDDTDEIDFGALNESLRSLAIAYVNEAFDWLGASIRHETDDNVVNVVIVLAVLDMGPEDDIARALSTVLACYGNALKVTP